MIVDLFAGPGGWDEGLRLLGRTDVIGVEMDKHAAQTRRDAGHVTVEADVTTLDPGDYAHAEGLIASPPCQTFSAAGLQAGLADVRGQLVYEVIRWAEAIRPAWIACEEVSEVLPIWRAFAEHLRGIGYTAWAGVLNAADYGIPQIRKRAFLLASRQPFTLPAPTHAADVSDDLFGSDLQPWVTAADALALTDDERDELNGWAWQRPATTVVRSFRPDVIAAPGYRRAGDGPRQNTPGSLTVTEEQLRVLQAVPAGYPIAGAKTKRLSLIGAFLPPPWAAAVLAPLLDANADRICTDCGDDDAAFGFTVCTDCLGNNNGR